MRAAFHAKSKNKIFVNYVSLFSIFQKYLNPWNNLFVVKQLKYVHAVSLNMIKQIK